MRTCEDIESGYSAPSRWPGSPSEKPDERQEPPRQAVENGAGDIRIEGEVGDLTVGSGAGRVLLNDVRCQGESLRVNTGAGYVHITLNALPRRRAMVNVGTGSVRMSLPAGARARVALKSGMGDVRSAFPLTPERKEKGFGGALSGELNGGGTDVRVDVGIGDARLERAR